MSNPVLKKITESGRGFAEMADGYSNESGTSITSAVNPPRSVDIDGVIVKTTGIAFLSMMAAFIGWNLAVAIMFIYPLLFFTSLILGVITAFKPLLAGFTAPLYALTSGLWIGTISYSFNLQYPGIVKDALLGTGVVFLTMLFLYRSKIVKVTAKLRSTVIAATMGIFIYYLLSYITGLITGNSLPLINSNSYLGILFTAAICLLAAYNFLLDFDNIEKAIANKIDSRYEWALSFGLLVTFVWLYIEILRLLSKLRSR
jgi:uncharacterized YccA/Bax inhibitor family protein